MASEVPITHMQSINCKSTKIKPFRTCSLLKNNQVPTYLSKWKKFDPEGMQKVDIWSFSDSRNF
jgi:hypothetical protein